MKKSLCLKNRIKRTYALKEFQIKESFFNLSSPFRGQAKKWLQWRTVALLIEWTVYMRKSEIKDAMLF
jgi:hypothetical protein